MHKIYSSKYLAVALATALSAGSLTGVPVLAQTVSADASGTTYNDSTDGGNAVLVDGSSVTLSNVTVTKTGGSSSEDADFYGTNAAILAKNNSTLTLTGSSVTSNGSHANAVFSYGSGTTVNVSDSTIRTSGNNSGGIMTTGGGTMNASNLDIQTEGNSSAAIRSDRGGGDVNVDGGTYVTNGVGSPVIYSTADIDVANASLTSTKSEAIVIEGGNSVSLTDCTVNGNNTTTNGQATNHDNVFIYQSMSGDASEGKSEFDMTGGSLTASTGDMFYVTNTTCTITLSGVTMGYADGDLIRLKSDAWGSSGSNGGNATFKAVGQSLAGNIDVDSISSLNLILDDASDFSGCIQSDGQTYVELADGAVWTLTADSAITSLTCDADSVNLNGHTLTVGGTAYTGGTASTGEAASQTSSGSSSQQTPGQTPPDGAPGQDQGSGERPEMPQDDGSRPEMPGQDQNSGDGPEMPQDDGSRPEMPGQDQNSGERPEMPQDDGSRPEMPGQNQNQKASLENATLTTKWASYAYTGYSRQPAPIVTLNGKTLVKDTDYTVSYKNNKDIGTATVTVTGIGNYTGTKSATFKITAASLSGATVKTKWASYSYNGYARQPAPIVTLNNKTLVKGTDYTVTYKNNRNVGTATMTVKGIGNYTGSKSATFKIAAASLTDASVRTKYASYAYTGYNRQPAPIVALNGRTLVKGTDFKVSYKNNKKVGTATMTVTGIGNYTGTKSATFRIVK